MRNFVQPGNVVGITINADRKSGDGHTQGTLFGIVTVDTKNGNVAQLMIEGVVALKKAAGVTPTEGAAISFDVATQTIVATGGKVIGVCVEGSNKDDATYADVKLIPVTA